MTPLFKNREGDFENALLIKYALYILVTSTSLYKSQQYFTLILIPKMEEEGEHHHLTPPEEAQSMSFFDNFVEDLRGDFERNISPLKKSKLFTGAQKGKKTEMDETVKQPTQASNSVMIPKNFTEKLTRNLVATEIEHIPPFSTRRVRTDW